ncbi:MAG: ATP-dependent DNA helicase RecG [Candidatus Margulisbacteria bacterium]|nr:ATP-dependent DNA helicase RecG [Candidatus Margulisiibacteriota bacterium]
MSNVKLETPAQYVKGVGPRIAKLLKKLEVETVEDLLYFFPRDYEDRTQIRPIARLQPSDNAIIRAEVASINHQITRNRFSILKVILSDPSGSIQAVWFNQPYLLKLFRRGMKLIVSGKIEYSTYEHSLQLTVKDFEVDMGDALGIVPHYPLTEGLYPKTIRSIIKTVLDKYLDDLKDHLPDNIRQEQQYPKLAEAVRTLHFPKSLNEIEPARQRLAFDDFFWFQLELGQRRKNNQKAVGIPLKIEPDKVAKAINALPFVLTGAQKQVMEEIEHDLQAQHPMNRLLQGDVGSGKTVIAVLAALIAINNGYQTAIMAPTEILAQQHFDKIIKLTKGLKIKVKLLTGTQQKKERTKIIDKWDLVIGTHALIEEQVSFRNLGLVIIDEQHRFGVMQRMGLVKKGANPHVLVMSATPIPRTLALMLYGDLDRSVIDEMPPGRTPIKTHFITQTKRKSAYNFIREKIKEGRQVFVVCPLVEQSEALDLKACEDEAVFLQKEVFPEYKVGLIHGRMSGKEKDAIMQAFLGNKINLLVSTTVIEVGIDVSNATIMLIEHAERFGLSQLHQLRGRVGRGSEQSYCFLVGNPKTPEAKGRIKAMLDTIDGFKIAEADLRLRGPGDVLGLRQSGLPSFRVADIIKDEKILQAARIAAFNLIEMEPEIARNIWECQR